MSPNDPHSSTPRRLRRGTVLVPALLAVMLTATLCVCYMNLSMSKNRESQTAVDAKRAFYVAEAGLAEGYYGLARGMQGAVASESVPARFGNGVYWVTAEDLGDRVTLHSTGLSGLGRAALSVTLRKAQSSVASLGLYGNSRVDLRAGSLVDAYNSSFGPYQPGGLGQLVPGGSTPAAKVGCNSSIALAGSQGLLPGAKIVGDATPGPSGSVLRGTGAIVTGSTAPAPETTALPALAIDVPPGSAALEPAAGSTLALGAGSYTWSNVHLAANTVVSVAGPAEIVADQLVLDGGARLEIDGSSGPVRIRVRSYLALAAGATLKTTSTDPTRVSLLVAASATLDRNGDGIADPPVTIAGKGPFHGFLYAPNAQVSLPSTFTVFGSVVADRIALAQGAQLHFDCALLDTLADGSLPQFLCWRVVELPPSRLVQLGYDPLTVLKTNAVVPVAPKDAHYAIGATPVAVLRAWIAPVTKL